MRPGGANAKGAAFERQVCAWLSSWLTHGGRNDVFTRNIISGAQFTSRAAAGDVERAGVPGDLMARHPLANMFLELFLVECKFHKDLGIDTFIYDMRGTSSLAKIISKCRKEADQADVNPMLVIKQNARPPLLLLDAYAGRFALQAVSKRLTIPYHVLHSGSVYVFDMHNFINTVFAQRMIELMRAPSPLITQG